MEAALATPRRADAEDAIRQGYNILILSDRDVSAGAAADPGAARHRRRAPAPGAQGPAHQRRASSSRPAPRARCTTSRCSPATAPRRSTRTSRWRRSPTLADGRARGVDRQGVAEALHQGDLQGPQQGDVQDGHLDLPVVLRRADLRGRRPAAGVRRQVLHRHREQRRGHRPVRGRRGVRAPAPRSRSATIRCCATRSTPGGEYAYRDPRRGAHVDAGLDRQAAARDARRTATRRTRNTRRSSTTRAAAEDAARPVRVPRRPRDAGPARRGRARRGDRQALRHRRDEPRLDLDRGAHDARHRDEPHRRQVEHRRGRRGRGRYAPSAASGDVAGRRHRGAIASTRRCRPATACARRSSRSRRAASASPPSTWRPPTRSRSRWRRAPSPARAGSCPVTRCPSTSPSCASTAHSLGYIEMGVKPGIVFTSLMSSPRSSSS